MEKVFGININGEFIGFVNDEQTAKNTIEKLSNSAEDILKKSKPYRTLYQERNEQRDTIKVYSMAKGVILDGALNCKVVSSYLPVTNFKEPCFCDFGKLENLSLNTPEAFVQKDVFEDLKKELMDETPLKSVSQIKTEQVELDKIFTELSQSVNNTVKEDLNNINNFDTTKLATFGPAEPSFKKIVEEKKSLTIVEENREVKIKFNLEPPKTIVIDDDEDWTEDDGSTNSEDDSEYIAPPRARIPFLYPQPQKILKYMGAV